MRLLLDHNLPRDLLDHLPDHDVRVAYDMGWAALTNGDILSAAEQAGFGAMLTADQGIRYQQNLQGRKIALLVLSTNHWPTIAANIGLILAALHSVSPGSYHEIALPRPKRAGRAPRLP